MVEYADSSQLNLWHFDSVEELDSCRSYANFRARTFLFERESGNTTVAAEESVSVVGSLPVSHFACDKTLRTETIQKGQNYAEKGPMASPTDKPYLMPSEEAVLVSFYVSKLPALIGPVAEVRRLRRESKVLATAASLYRRFFLSNSVMLFDPKVVMVAAAFLASKVEDATADVRYLEEGTVAMNAAVTTQEIVMAEVALLAGTHFHLLCFHPYKAVLALTEDLRTFLKTAAGKKLQPQQNHQLTGQDLKPMYDAARVILDDVVVSDIPLLFTPGQIGLAALTVAQDASNTDADTGPHPRAKIDLLHYLQARFPQERADWMPSTVQTLTTMIRELKDGRHGCGNYNTPLIELKAIHKKLKSVRAWGEKKSKKRNKGTDDNAEPSPPSKRVKTE
jgi:cyclin H